MSENKASQETSSDDNNWFEDVFMDTLNKTMNKILSYDFLAVKKLDTFAGKIIHIILDATPFEFYILINNRQITLNKNCSNDPDTTIKGTPIALFAMSLDEQIEGIKNVEIHGDANTGQYFAKWLKNLEPDWEEAWCELLGDGMGVRVSAIVSGAFDFGKRIKDSFIQNTNDYLVEESRDLIAATEMEEFLDDVDDLKADTARLEQQIKEIKAK